MFDKVIKRDGSTEPFMPEKTNRVVEWAAEGTNVQPSEILMAAANKVEHTPKTSEIHEALIASAVEKISTKTPSMSKIAARLKIFAMRKEAYGTFTPPEFYIHVVDKVAKGIYDSHILEDYSREEIEYLGSLIDHNLDLEYEYAAVVQWREKYLVQDRVTKQLFESPQFANMLIGMCLFANKPKNKRLELVQELYETLATGEASLPTPIMGGVRTTTRQFSSCVLIESGDSLDSIFDSATAIGKYVAKRAGIGINGGAIRALGSPIRNGSAVHTGVVPFYRHFLTALKSCSQGALRGGAGTLFYPIWHLEAENLLVLKNNRGTEDNRIRQMDYGVQISKLFYTRLQKKQNITLFSPDVANGELYKLFFENEQKFTELYEKLEQDPTVRKKEVPAIQLFLSLATERSQTGRIYIHNVDNTYQQGVFKPEVAPVRQSNLCVEVLLPTSPMGEPDEEIALCTLAAINVGLVNTYPRMQRVASIIVQALDALLDYQDYPVSAALKNKLRRTLGVGIINYANFLAQNEVKYTDSKAKKLTHELMEIFQYSLLKASNELAKEEGACELFSHTKYAEGLLPIDNYKKSVDKLVDPNYVMDWETLRENIKKYGLRNSTLSALMPSETSSQISNSTNGIEPPRSLVTAKKSKDGIYRQVVPNVENLKDHYTLAWDKGVTDGYLQLVGIMQKFVDQSISANTYYDPKQFQNGKVTTSKILKDLLLAYSYGIKTLYYHNTLDKEDDDSVLENNSGGCDSGGCVI